jgi:hypothetical protein
MGSAALARRFPLNIIHGRYNFQLPLCCCVLQLNVSVLIEERSLYQTVGLNFDFSLGIVYLHCNESGTHV